MRIAFIGLGNMGAPMARNLIKAGHQLNLFDLNKAVLAELAELGGQISPSPKDAAANSELTDIAIGVGTGEAGRAFWGITAWGGGLPPMCSVASSGGANL